MGKDDFTKIPNGAGGVEHRLALLYTYGVLTDKISLNQMVALTSTNPAKIFGLYPDKGVIRVGSDADMVVWNPEIMRTISVKTHHSQSDNTIFEGFETKGAPVFVVTKGRIVVENNRLFEDNCSGVFIKRYKS